MAGIVRPGSEVGMENGFGVVTFVDGKPTLDKVELVDGSSKLFLLLPGTMLKQERVIGPLTFNGAADGGNSLSFRVAISGGAAAFNPTGTDHMPSVKELEYAFITAPRAHALLSWSRPDWPSM